MITETSIKELKGIGEKTEKLFAKIGISTVGDIIREAMIYMKSRCR